MMARRSSSSRWSRPASGKQIAALKSHGNYDGKYYSMGRASQAIGRSMASGGGTRRSSSAGYPASFSAASSTSSFLAQLMGTTDDLESLISAAIGQSGLGSDPQFGELPVESVAFTVSPDETHPDGPRIVFEADVVCDSDFSGDPSLEVRFVSNVVFEDGASPAPQGFSTGVQFDD